MPFSGTPMAIQLLLGCLELNRVKEAGDNNNNRVGMRRIFTTFKENSEEKRAQNSGGSFTLDFKKSVLFRDLKSQITKYKIQRNDHDGRSPLAYAKAC